MSRLIQQAESIWNVAIRASTPAYVVAIGLAILSLLVLAPDFGQSWDIIHADARGSAAYEFYLNGFDGDKYRASLPPLSIYYGSAFDFFVRLFQNVTQDPVQRFQIRTVLQALFALSGLIPVFLISSRVLSKPLALVAVILVGSTPVLFGHAFINPKDTIFMSAFLWSIYLIVSAFEPGARSGLAAWVLAGMAIGFSASIRPVGILLLVIAPLLTVILPVLRSGADTARGFFERLWGFTAENVVPLSILTIVAATTYVVCMPTFLANLDVTTATRTVETFANHPWRGWVAYFGRDIYVRDLPWHYLFGYAFVQLPLYYHLFILVGVLALVLMPGRAFADLRELFENDERAFGTVAALFIAFALPVVLIVLSRPVLYDGIRQVLFLVPLLCLLLFFAFFWTVRQLPLAAATGLVIVGVACWAQAIYGMRQLHPYEYAYYNPIKERFGRFDLDYWGTSFREIAQQLNAGAKSKDGRPLRVAVYGPAYSLATFLTPGKFEAFYAERVDPKLRDSADIIVALNRFDYRKHARGKKIVAKVSRGGQVLAVAVRN